VATRGVIRYSSHEAANGDNPHTADAGRDDGEHETLSAAGLAAVAGGILILLDQPS
jgi:hypothetical protein